MHGRRVREGKKGRSRASSRIDARKKQGERARGGYAAFVRSVSIEQRGGGRLPGGRASQDQTD